MNKEEFKNKYLASFRQGDSEKEFDAMIESERKQSFEEGRLLEQAQDTTEWQNSIVEAVLKQVKETADMFPNSERNSGIKDKCYPIIEQAFKKGIEQEREWHLSNKAKSNLTNLANNQVDISDKFAKVIDEDFFELTAIGQDDKVKWIKVIPVETLDDFLESNNENGIDFNVALKINKAKKDEAVRFAEWIADNKYKNDGKTHWYSLVYKSNIPPILYFTTEQLYKKFKDEQ